MLANTSRCAARKLLPIGASTLFLFLWPSLSVAAPVANDDLLSTVSGTSILAQSVAANDENLAGSSSTFALESNPSNGIATVYANGSIDYIPNVGFASTDAFTYRVTDSAGESDTATVTISVSTPSDYISAQSSIVIGDEDEAIPLGLSVSDDLFNGGALQDVIATDILFRADNAGSAAFLSNIPEGSSGITITGYSTRFTGTNYNDSQNDDYQLLNVRVNLVDGTSSGRLNLVQRTSSGNLNQFAWEDVPLGQPVLSDTSLVVGEYTGTSNPTFSIVAGQLQIVETHSLETAYHIEYMTSVGNSTNFLSAGTAVQTTSDTTSTIPLPSELEASNGGKNGFIVLSGASAANGGAANEYKGFSRFVLDLESATVSGAIAVVTGETSSRTVTWAFEDYPLIDLRQGAFTVSPISSMAGNIIGDTTANANTIDDPIVYIDANGNLIVTRAADFAAKFSTMYTAEFYQRTGFGSIASSVAVESDDSLFDASPGDGVDGDGKAIDYQSFLIPASASVGLMQMSWNTTGGSDTNENTGFGFAVIDIAKGTSSGSITFLRATTPDLLTWDAVPLGETFFGATNSAGTALYQSNKTAGRFTDRFVESAKLSLVNNADGSKSLTFTATSNGGTGGYLDYRGNAQVSWLGSEPFTMDGIPATASLSHGAPISANSWELDFSDISALEYIPAPHASGATNLYFEFGATGESEAIDVIVQPVADAPVLTTEAATGYIGNSIPILLSFIPSADTDGSETQQDSLTISNVPADVTLSSSAGLVTDNGAGNWVVSLDAMATLVATGSTATNTTVTVSTTNVDSDDIDADSVIENGDNGTGVDETDQTTVSENFQLSIRQLPTVDSVLTNIENPTITGTVSLTPDEIFTVTVNGITYTNGDGNLEVSADGTWTLNVPNANALSDNVYTIDAKLNHANGNSGADESVSELVVDLTPPVSPTVVAQITNTVSPPITGSMSLGAGEYFSVQLNGTLYSLGDGNLVDHGDGSWTLTPPLPLDEGTYEIVASSFDEAGNSSTDSSSNELIIDLTPPPAPGVTSQTTPDSTPVIIGTSSTSSDYTLKVTVNGEEYTAGDGHLVNNADGTWQLQIPAGNELPDSLYQVIATATDLAGNTSIDPGQDELAVDTIAPASPGVTSHTTNDTTPIIEGIANVGAGEILTVTVNGTTYTAGEGQLNDNADGTWTLSIPSNLAEAVYDVTATLTDNAGNSSSDPSSGELLVDTTPPVTPSVVSQSTNNTQPTISGTAVKGASETLTVIVNEVSYFVDGGHLIDNMDGTWSLTIPTALTEGSYDVTATITDAAGNITTDATNGELIIDTSNPATPAIDYLTTSNTLPTLTGNATLEVTEVLSITLNSAVYESGDTELTIDSTGKWNLDVSAELGEGTYEVIATITDNAGNTSVDISTLELVVDTTDPAIPSVQPLITSEQSPTINGLAVVGSGEFLTVTVNGVIYASGDGHLTEPGDGTWNLTIPLILDEGIYNITATVEDAAENFSIDTSSAELTIDTSPPIAPTVFTLSTNNVTPSINGTATLLPGETLSVIVNGSTYHMGDGTLSYNDDNTWTLTVPTELPETVYSVNATITDAAGNTSSDQTDDELIVDTTPPVVPIVDALITNESSPTITGTATLENDEELSVIINGIEYTANDSSLSINGDGTWAIEIADLLSEGNYEVSATVTDASGNASIDSTTSELRVDLTAPAIPTVTALNTNDPAPTLTGTTTLEQGESLTLSVNGITYDQGNAALNVDNTGAWQLAIPHSLADGIYEVVAIASDQAGNSTSDTSVSELTIDTVAPPVPIVDVLVTNDTTPVLSGSAVIEPGDSLDVLVDGTNYTLGDSFLILELDGTWSLAVSTPLSEGIFDIAVTITDWVGNSSTDASTNEVTVDVTAPAVPTAMALSTNVRSPNITGFASVGVGETLSVTVNEITYTLDDEVLTLNDDGLWTLAIPTLLSESSFDVTVNIIDEAGNASFDTTLNELLIDTTPPLNPTVLPTITNDTTPMLSGTASVNDGETLLIIVNGVSYVAGEGVVDLASNGNWNMAIPTPIAEAQYDVSAVVFDISGNSATDTTDGELIVDTTPPPAPGVTSQTTPDASPTIEGTAITDADEFLQVSVNGYVYQENDGFLINNNDGTWVLQIPTDNSLADQLYDVIATTFDLAGNSSSDPGIDELLVDTLAPRSPGVTSLTTNDTTPVLHGNAELDEDEILNVTVNGVTYNQGENLIVVGNVWTLNLPFELSEGKYDVTATSFDRAGNSSSDPSSQELYIDTTAPALAAAAPESIVSHQPLLEGTSNVPDGSEVSVRNSQGALICVAEVIAGLWSCTPLQALNEGAQRLQATTTDPAGNISSEYIYFIVPDDFDADGIINSIEGTGDQDNDGVSNQLDLDSDNDGIPDNIEGTRDSDGDGIADYLDLDTDNDGIADIIEVLGEDRNNDFKVDDPIYSDANGLSDDVSLFPYTLLDTDSDRIPDFRDLDSDQDGISDLIESGGIDDDNNGRVDDFVDANDDGIDDVLLMMEPAGIDTDSDGIPNRLDLDADNDGDFDALEAGAHRTDETGVLNPMTDSDRDGLPDSVDSDFTQGLDTDGDGIDDNFDVSIVGGSDTDGDGVIDSADPDANGDGLADNPENFLTNGNELPDFDGNNVPDVFEFNDGVLRSGLTGRAGCSIAGTSQGWKDPSFLILILSATTLYFLRLKRRRKLKTQSKCNPSLPRQSAIVLSTLLLLSPHINANADEDFERKPWVGVSTGLSSIRPDASEIRYNVVDDQDTASRGVLGMDISPRLSAEISYSDLGRTQLSSDHFIDYQQLGVDALIYGLSSPVNRSKRQGLLPFLRLGASHMKNQSDIEFEQTHSISLSAGVGVEYGFSNGIAIRTDAISFDADSHFVGIGVIYRPQFRQKDYVEPPLTVPASIPEAKAMITKVSDLNIPTLGPVLFNTAEFTPRQNTLRSVEIAISTLLENPTLQAEIIGYADTRGPWQYNLELSRQRAESVKQLFIQNGISALRVSITAEGETDQFGSMATIVGRQQNRRVVLKIF